MQPTNLEVNEVLDPNPFTRGRVGVIFPQLDYLTEPWLASVLPRGVSFHVSRMARTGPITRDSLMMMNAGMPQALSLLPLPYLDLVVYHCTAGSLLYEPSKLVAEMESHAQLPAIATMQAVIDGMRQLAVSRIVMVTPYMAWINDYEAQFLNDRGFTVVGVGGVELEDAGLQQSIPADEICLWVRRAFRKASGDAVFISCTGLRSLSFIDELEADLGVPVITSGGAMLWAMLHRLGISDGIPHGGRLVNSRLASNGTVGHDGPTATVAARVGLNRLHEVVR